VKLEGVSALVTGGAGGLGEATSRQLVAAGAHVVIADVNDEVAGKLAADLGPKALYVRTDVTNEESVQAAIAAAQELAPLRVAVNAHGGSTGGGGGRLVSRDGTPHALEPFQLTLNLFLTGTFNVMRLAAAAMAGQEPVGDSGRGVIVNTASIAAFEGQIGQVAYSAAKGGVVGMTLVAARDMAAAGVRVVTIAPGTFMTPAFRAEPEVLEERFGKTVPFPNRMGRPPEYAALVQHIVENDYLNGEVIRLDGALRFSPK